MQKSAYRYVTFCRSTRSPTSPIQEEEDEEHMSDLSDAQPRPVRPYSPAPTEVSLHLLTHVQHHCCRTWFINNLVFVTCSYCCSTLLGHDRGLFRVFHTSFCCACPYTKCTAEILIKLLFYKRYLVKWCCNDGRLFRLVLN